jgi:hypothetical protein
MSPAEGVTEYGLGVRHESALADKILADLRQALFLCQLDDIRGRAGEGSYRSTFFRSTRTEGAYRAFSQLSQKMISRTA